MSEHAIRINLNDDHIAKLRIVRDAIRTEPEKFCMDIWECGSAACIGGWLVRLFVGDKSWSTDSVGELIGLTREQSDELFFMRGNYGYFTRDVHAKQAVAMINNMIEKRVIDWPRAIAGQ